MNFAEILEQTLSARGLSPDTCESRELLYALLAACRRHQRTLSSAAGKRKLYYFSAEFLMGRLLRANLMNLGLLDETERFLASHGRSLARVEDCEPEPSLGNGGLGRLAACFLDSMASLSLPGDGMGLNYHYGLFRQSLSGGAQRELPDPWIEPESWLEDMGTRFTVPFGGFSLKAHLFDLEIPGYENGICNHLHLFDVEYPAPAPEHGIDFDKGDIAHCLTSFLYPDDSDEAGRLLRLYQQYFLASAGAQLILKELEEHGHSPEELDRYAIIHINDTHPSMVIPELIRLLTERGVESEEAIRLTEHTCAYTNHTILAEALEKWPLSSLEKVAPQLLPIIRLLDSRAKERCADPAAAIIDEAGTVHMARMDIHSAFSVNGVAALHTKILEDTELHVFYRLYPEKFNNKTNGVTFRRWLMACNPALSSLIDEAIGPAWKKDPDALRDLLPFRGDGAFLSRLLAVKRENKSALSGWLLEKQGAGADADSVFDFQVKRMHPYKRQQMNALYAIWKYFQILEGHFPPRPLTILWGAKAAPAYTLAKDIIHLILCLRTLIDSDPLVSSWLKLLMVENYNVSAAEMLVPACDVSEQISLASREASGTSNMKLMANGAVTLGTLDGANVEIADLVGRENIFLFGRSSEEVIAFYESGGYRSSDFCKDPEIRRLVDFITDPALLRIGDPERLNRLREDFLTSDYFMVLPDLKHYISVKESCLRAYEDRTSWGRKALTNIALSGYFSSDRTIREYNRDIWHLG